jgi:two-component system CheB/CheR fusion protein
MENSHVEIKLPDDMFIPMEDFYALIISSLQDYSIITTDRNLMINCWCAGAEKIFGYQREEILGKHIGIIFTEEDKENGVPQQEMVTALKEGKASDNRWHIGKDGKMFFAFGLMFPINDRENKLIGFVKILRDLTERKMAEDAFRKKMRELEELNNHKDTILAILSHDLRSPLGSIIEITEYLKNFIDEIEPEEVKKMLAVLNQSSTTELEILDSLLEWARIRYASEAFSPILCNLHNAVNKVYDHLSELASTHMVKLANEVDDSIVVFADKKMLFSILQNLVSNSIKFTGSGGKITVSASTHDSTVTVQVQDTGIGMSADQVSKLFTPQVKTLAQARKEEKGAGIGLLLVKNFLEKNRGEIWVKSAKGKGSSFFFTLPVKADAQPVFSAEPIQFGEGV